MSIESHDTRSGKSDRSRRRTSRLFGAITLVVGIALVLLVSFETKPGGARADSNLDPSQLPGVLVTPAELNRAFTLSGLNVNASAMVVGLGQSFLLPRVNQTYLSQVDGLFSPTDRAPRGVAELQISLLAFRDSSGASSFLTFLTDTTPNLVAGVASPFLGDAGAIVLNTSTPTQITSRVVARRGNIVFGVRVLATPSTSAVDVALDVARAQLKKIDAALFGSTAAQTASPTPTRSATPTPSPTPATTTPSPTATATPRPSVTPRPTASPAPPVALPTPTDVSGSDEDPPQPSL